MKPSLVFALIALFLFAGTLAAQTSTTTTLNAVTPSPSVFGQSVTLSAQVAPAGASGSVTFMDGVLMLGAGPLNGSGVAQKTTLSLSAGSHSLRAVYGGDGGGYLSSQSASVPYAVNVQPAAGFSFAGYLGTGVGPRSVASSDFNGDGIADLATANYLSDNVSILLGSGNGSFQPAVNYGAGYSPCLIAAGEFNEDGLPDLVIGNCPNYDVPHNNTVSILLGNGNGTFQAAASYIVGESPNTLVIADFNGDGSADLAVAINHSISVLLGNGNGTFQSAVNYVSPYQGVWSVAAGDFNGDGIPDLVMSHGHSNLVCCDGILIEYVSTLIGVGDGTFQNGVSVGVGAQVPLVAVGDFNGDGLSDIAAIPEFAGYLNILLGNGNGTFQPAITQLMSSTQKGPLTLSDFNGDGRLDFAYSYHSGGISVWLGSGNGTFYSGGGYSGGNDVVTVGDFNGDGRPDLSVVDVSHERVGILLGLGTSYYSLSVNRVGDGDGAINISGTGCSATLCNLPFNFGQVVTLTATPRYGSFFVGWTGDADCSDGNVTMTTSLNCVARFDRSQQNLARLRGDFNGDARSDILWQHTDGSSTAWLMNGLNPSSAGALPGPGSGWSVKDRGDFNGDGKSDILWQRTDGSTAVSLVDGLNLVSSALLIGPGTGWSVKLVGDFNADSTSDILWQRADGSTTIWLMNGVNMVTGGGILGPGTGWSASYIGDFDNNGKSDIVWQHADGSVAIWLMNGVTLIKGGGILGPGTGWSVKQVADFNGDGKSDILWQQTDGSAAIWLMNGLDVSSRAGILGPGTGWIATLFGDFNGDRNSDIVWQHADGSVAIWLMNGVNTSSGALVLGPGSGWSPLRIGDFDGDGKSDILWRHTDGSVALWLMNGTNVSGAAGLLGSGTGWKPA